MAELKWELQPNGWQWMLISLGRVQRLASVWQSHDGTWFGNPFGDNKYPDAETAMRAAEVELIRRCKEDLLALEDLRGE